MVKIAKLTALASVILLTTAGCAANENLKTPVEPSSSGSATDSGQAQSENLQGNLIGVGASSQGEAQNSWIASFFDQQQGMNVSYDPAGSGAGRESFQQGASDFAGSDRAFKIEEIAEGGFASCLEDSGLVQLPVYISPIAIIFNLSGVESVNLDPKTIAKIFTGEIAKWNDPLITSQNPDIDLPDLTITAVHRADKSGTTANFTDYLAAAAPTDWEHGSVEEWPINGGEAAAQTSGVVNAVRAGLGSIGYVDASRSGELGKVKVKVGDEYVAYSAEAAAAILDASEFESGRAEGDLAISIDRKTEAAGSYPIVLVSYVIGCETYADAEKAKLVAEYFSFMASSEGQEIAAVNAGSAPISDSLREKVKAAIDLIA